MQIFTIILGIALLIGSLFYGKEQHKKFSEGASKANYSDSLIALIVITIISFFLSIGPWWLTKTIFIVISLSVIYLGFFLL